MLGQEHWKNIDEEADRKKDFFVSILNFYRFLKTLDKKLT